MYSGKTGRQFFNFHNLYFQHGIKVSVPPGTRAAYVPRKCHYSPTVIPDSEESRLQRFHDDLEPCVVRRPIFGWPATHKCKYHTVRIEEKRT